MLPTIARATSAALNDFRKCQTLDIAQTILQQRKNAVLESEVAAHTGALLSGLADAIEGMHAAGDDTKVGLQ